MKQHQFKITVEHIADKDGNPVSREPLQFLVPNHDDIFDIIERVKQRNDMDEQTATRFAVGLKLFTETAMENKDHDFFIALKPHIMTMMQIIKGKN